MKKKSKAGQKKKVVRRSAYAKAGVDIDAMMTGLSASKKLIESTRINGVLSNIGSFGGLFTAPGKDHVLVASTDGVGTKLNVAVQADRHTTIGQDLVNHCVNDILVQGARPLFFLDYLGTSKLQSCVFRDILQGLCKACKENGCALLGGETAEMPGLYPQGEYDLVGTIIGTVKRDKIITGNAIRPGDTILGLPSTGLHTNGYSLARKVIFEQTKLKIGDKFPGTSKSVGNILLAIHRSYLKPVTALMKVVNVRGMAHITGGGFYDNIPRVLPRDTTAVIDRNSWKVPALFKYIEQHGNVKQDEMYRVFNMGIGMVVFIRQKDAATACSTLKSAGSNPFIIGHVKRGKKGIILVN